MSRGLRAKLPAGNRPFTAARFARTPRPHAALLTLSLAAAVLAAGCARVTPPAAPSGSAGRADFTRYVAVGNSLTAGYQSGGLVEAGQDAAYPVLIARQARVPAFHHPRISSPGIPALLVLDFEEPTPPLLPFSIRQPPGEGVLENAAEAPYQNLGVPGARVGDFFSTDTSGYYGLVLQGGGSMWTQLKAQHPTFVTFWLGNNDALVALLEGTPDSMTSPASFEASLRADLDSVLSTGAHMVVANVPDVTDVPFATTIPPYAFDPVNGEPLLFLGSRINFLGVRDDGTVGPMEPGTLVTLAAVSDLLDGTGLPVSAGGNGRPLPGDVVLTPREVEACRVRIQEFNDSIRRLCAERGVPVADAHQLLGTLAREGYSLAGIPYNSRFLFGGIFSLDGIHPTAFGQALVANEWIRVINRSYGSQLPPVDLSAYVPPPPLSGAAGSAAIRHDYESRPAFLGALRLALRWLEPAAGAGAPAGAPTRAGAGARTSRR